MPLRLTMALSIMLVAGCAAEIASPSAIESRRVLAVRSTPPEAAPGDSVRFEALIVDPDGPIEGAAVSWAFCVRPKPPTQNNVVDDGCLTDAGVTPIPGMGPAITATIPGDGCRLFGPESPGPGLRPRDADVTGGYFQPIRLALDDTYAFGLERLRCNLAQAPLSVAQAFQARYTANQNPTIEGFAVVEAGGEPTLELVVADGSAESFVRFDPSTRVLVDDRETLTVSWFSTGGVLSAARSDVTDGRATVAWSPPDDGAEVHLFAVLRDARGGLDFATLRLPAP